MPKEKPLSATVDYEKLETLCSFGLIDEQLAKFYGVCTKTIKNWKSNRLFLAAMKRGKEIADSQVEEALFHRAIGYSHPEEKIFCHEGVIVRADTIKHYPPEPVACIFWLKNRKRLEWRDKAPDEEMVFPDINIFVKTTIDNGGGNGNGNGSKKTNRTTTTVQRFQPDGSAKLSLPDTL